MNSPVKVNFKIYQGSTFKEVLRWEASTKVYKPITAIVKEAPVSITATAHGIPDGWRVKVTNVLGMKEINSDEYRIATVVTSNIISINSINPLSYADYTSGGILEYNLPVDLTNYSGRMQLRAKLDSEVVLLELTTANSGIVIDNTLKTITINITAVQTAAFDFPSAVYSLELYTGTGVVVPFAGGSISVIKEVTR